MTSATAIFAITLAALVVTDVGASGWKYEDEAHWSPKCQDGKKQSPIALSRSHAKITNFKPFHLRGYDQHVTAALKNNGHSAEVRPFVQSKPEISGGGLNDVYVLDHLHFHWQSEHVMENYRFPLELHLVHHKAKYDSLTESLQHHEGVAVFAVLFDLSPDDDEDFQPLLKIVDNLKDKPQTPNNLTDFVIKGFLPRNLAGYYRYEGSLTTPGCDEGVVWTIFTNTIPISKDQVKIFESMHTDEHNILKKNFRSLQPLNNRDLYLKVSPIREAYSNTNQIRSHSVLLLTISACVLMLRY